MNDTIHYLWVDVSWRTVCSETERVDIGFYSVPELVIYAAECWLLNKFENDMDICFRVLRGERNKFNDKLISIDWSDDRQDVLLKENLRKLANKYMKLEGIV